MGATVPSDTSCQEIAQCQVRPRCRRLTCPWSGKPVQADSLTTYNGNVVGFRNTSCRDKFELAAHHFDKAKPAGS